MVECVCYTPKQGMVHNATPHTSNHIRVPCLGTVLETAVGAIRPQWRTNGAQMLPQSGGLEYLGTAKPYDKLSLDLPSCMAC